MGSLKDEKAAYRITDLASSERPRERLAAVGSENLSNAELMAILIRVGVVGENAVQVGHRLLTKYGGLLGLHKLSYEDLCEEHGIGPAKAAQIKAAIELAHRISQEIPDPRPTVHSPSDAAALVQHAMSVLEQEELWVLLLDTRNQVISTERVYRGSLNQSQVRIAELFKQAIRRAAAAIIVVHNHPSGDPAPSPDDVAITRAILQAGKLLDIDVLDHLVIGQGKGRWVSMKDRGLFPA